jgi:hypothetical protein
MELSLRHNDIIAISIPPTILFLAPGAKYKYIQALSPPAIDDLEFFTSSDIHTRYHQDTQVLCLFH